MREGSAAVSTKDWQAVGLGALGFIVAAMIAFACWLFLSQLYRSGYEAGYKCGKFDICP